MKILPSPIEPVLAVRSITRIASWLHHGEGGYRSMLDRVRAGGGLPYPSGAER